MKKLLIIDGNSVLNRAFYGVGLLSTREGIFTNAVYGMTNIVLHHIEEQKPDALAVAFDVHEPTFRHKEYEGYKGTRNPPPAELIMQFPYAKSCMAALGAHCLELGGYEADDILGTLAAMGEREGYETCIVTGDKDSLQLISDRTLVMLASKNESIRFDTAHFTEVYGLHPSQFVDVKALMGDTSDNIPGVPGIGEKTALKLIAEYGSLDSLYNGLEDKKIAPGVKTKLTDNKDKAYFSKWLATIKRDVPLSLSLDDLAYRGMDKKAMLDLCIKLEFSVFIKRFDLIGSAGSNKEAKAGKALTEDGSAPSGRSVSPGRPADAAKDESLAFSPDKDNRPEENGLRPGESAKPSYSVTFPALSMDFEAGQAVLWDSSAKILPLDRAAALLADPKGHYVLYDCKTVFHALSALGYEVKASVEDVMLMGYIFAAGDGDFSLEKLSMRFLFSEAESGEEKARAAAELYTALEEELTRTNCLSLYREVELPLAAVLYDMEQIGFRIDTEKLTAFGEMLEAMQNEYAQRIFLLAGEEFNINSPKQLGSILFEKMGLPAGKKTKSGYSTNADILEGLRKYSPIIDEILDYRQVGKLKSTYADGLLKVADEKGRVHTCFKQALTATGRLSSTEPNLQNIPIRTELGREMRKFFVAKNENYVLVDADYSQIELRLLAALSGDENMIAAFRSGFDIHTDTAMRIFHVPRESVSIEMRKKAKAINFGIMYGMGEFSLSGDLHTTRAEAAAYIRDYMNSYPKVERYLHDVVEKAHSDLFVTTFLGRRRFIPSLASPKKMERAFGERVAMNSPIQGTAADIIKLAMIGVWRRLKKENLDAHLILQVHDELIIESHRDCAEKVTALLKEEMERAVSLAVPLTAEVGVGNNWFEAH